MCEFSNYMLPQQMLSTILRLQNSVNLFVRNNNIIIFDSTGVDPENLKGWGGGVQGEFLKIYDVN